MKTKANLKRPVFVVSTGRAGSNMITCVMAENPLVCSFHELKPHLKTEAFKKWTAQSSSKRIENRINNKRSDIIRQVESNGLIYFESSYYLSFFILELYKLYNAKFIHIYRDGRYFVRSALSKGWYKEEPLKYRVKDWIRRQFLVNIGHQMKDKELKPPKRLKTRFEKTSWLWAETNNTILNSLSKIPAKNKISLPLEEFNKEQLIRLHDFIGIPTDPVIINKMINIAVQKPNRSKTHTSKPVLEWSDAQNDRFDEIASGMMFKLGYYSPKERE